jgi:hypothetical protein
VNEHYSYTATTTKVVSIFKRKFVGRECINRSSSSTSFTTSLVHPNAKENRVNTIANKSFFLSLEKGFASVAALLSFVYIIVFRLSFENLMIDCFFAGNKN